jgi:hypothetical protein
MGSKGEVIYAIASIKFPTYGEIKDFFAWIIFSPHVTTIFTIIVVDLHVVYGVVIGREWCFPLGGYIMNCGSCMVFPNKDGGFTRVPHKNKNPLLFKKKEMEVVLVYIDVGHGNYTILCEDNINIEDNDQAPFQGFWKILFDGASSKVRVGAGVVFKNPQGGFHPHAFRLQFLCKNNGAKYEYLIQGLTLTHWMDIIDLVVMGGLKLFINHV